MLGALAAPSFVKSFGLKKIVVVGGIAFSLVILAQILPAYYNELQNDDA